MEINRESGEVYDAKDCPACGRRDVVIVNSNIGHQTVSHEHRAILHWLYCVRCGLGGPKLDTERAAFFAWQELPRE